MQRRVPSISKLLIAALVLASAVRLASAADPPEVPALPQTQILFESGKEGYHTFRIPAVVTAAKGTILAFAEGRKRSAQDSGDIDVVLKRSTDGGETWGALQVVADAGIDTIGNPCPVLDRTTHRIWLPVTGNPGRNSGKQNESITGDLSRQVWMCYSDDEGATWSERKNITADVKRDDWSWYATGPGNAIQLHDGRLVVPCDHMLAAHPGTTTSHIIYSDDHGKTWKLGGSVEEKTDECQVVELPNGELLLSMRSQHGKERRAFSTSKDRGETWTPVKLSDALYDPVCQGSMIRLPQGADEPAARLVFSNPHGPGRSRMTVRLSNDNGSTWPIERVLFEGTAAYSSLVALPDDQIGCLYERQEKTRQIAFAKFPLKWLQAGPKAGPPFGTPQKKQIKNEKTSALQPAEAQEPAGLKTQTLIVGETQRTYSYHLPPHFDRSKPTPLVLALHGGAMNGRMMADFCGLNRKADEAGFIVIYPDGTGIGPFKVWNSGGVKGAFAKGRPDDVSFIEYVIDDACARFKIDETRIYSTGMSNGGMMCYRLAAELSDRIAAIAPVAGTMTIPDAYPKRPVPVIHFHGSADPIVPMVIPDGFKSPFVRLDPLDVSIQTWVRLNGCEANPSTDVLSTADDEMKVTRTTFSSHKSAAEVVTVIVEGAGHTWPGEENSLKPLGKSTTKVSANDLMWTFFQAHDLNEQNSAKGRAIQR